MTHKLKIKNDLEKKPFISMFVKNHFEPVNNHGQLKDMSGCVVFQYNVTTRMFY